MASMQRYIDKAKKDLGDFNVPDRTPSSKTEKDSRLKILKDAASGEYKVGKKKVSKGRIVEMKKGGKVPKSYYSALKKKYGTNTKKSGIDGPSKTDNKANTKTNTQVDDFSNKPKKIKRNLTTEKVIAVKKGGTITSNINARSKKSKAELDAIGKKKPILDDNKAADQAFKDMDSHIANRKKEKKDFSKMRKNDFSKMTTEQLIELHRRQRDLGNTSTTKNYKKGGLVSPPKKRGDIGQKVFLSKVAKQMKKTGQPFGGKAKKKAEGGSLKTVPSENTGLGKLPTPVRNKMGYMKNGGIVKMQGGGAATRGTNFNRGY